MKTLEQIKNEYAVSKSFIDWDDLVYDLGYNRPSRLLDYIDSVMQIYAMECLKLAMYNSSLHGYDDEIVNENNIIK